MQWELVVKRNIPFEDLEALQKSLREKVANTENFGFFLAAEPQSTFTAGRSASPKDLLWDPAVCALKGIATLPVSRGGKWTYHGPGQIVIYPIFRLNDVGLHRKAARTYAEILGNAVIKLLTEALIPASLSQEPFGVYCREKKIASFGFDLRDGIATHGVAVYLESQRIPFEGIHPCGVPSAPLTSLREEGFAKNWDATALQLIEHIKKGLIPS